MPTQDHYSLPQTRCDDEHLPCCSCNVCLIEEDRPLCELPFITSCVDSQARQRFALFSSSPALVASIWAIAWLGCEVCLCVSPLSSFSAIFLSQCKVTHLMTSTLAVLPLFLYQWLSGKETENPEITHVEAIHRCCVLALRKNQCFKE